MTICDITWTMDFVMNDQLARGSRRERVVVQNVSFCPTWRGDHRWRVDFADQPSAYVWTRRVANQLDAHAGDPCDVVVQTCRDAGGRRWRKVVRVGRAAP